MQALAAVAPSSRPGGGWFRRAVDRATRVPAPRRISLTTDTHGQLSIQTIGRSSLRHSEKKIRGVYRGLSAMPIPVVSQPGVPLGVRCRAVFRHRITLSTESPAEPSTESSAESGHRNATETGLRRRQSSRESALSSRFGSPNGRGRLTRRWLGPSFRSGS